MAAQWERSVNVTGSRQSDSTKSDKHDLEDTIRAVDGDVRRTANLFTPAEQCRKAQDRAALCCFVRGLQEAFSLGVSIGNAKQILRRIPPSSPIQDIEWDIWEDYIPSASVQELLLLIQERCDPLQLTRLRFLPWNDTWCEPEEESIETGEPDQIDLAALYASKTGGLEYLIVHLPWDVLITPKVFKKIASVWPQLRCLVLCPRYSSSHVPLVNHEDVARLVRSLPSLRELGLRFDATRIPEGGHTPVQDGKLRKLHVGGSPICSPLRTVAWIRRNFPLLEELDTTYHIRPDEGTLHVTRWKAVLRGWNASRASP